MGRQSRKSPFVSVVVPTRNRVDLLGRCLASLHAQTLSADRYEIVVVDDGSTDGTSEFLSRTAGIRDIQQEWQGMVAARNAGIAAAKGNIVSFIDDDAEAGRGWLEALVEALMAPDVGMVGGRVRDAPVRQIVAQIDSLGRLEGGAFDAVTDGPIEVDYVPGGNMAMWRDVLDTVGGFDPTYTRSAWREETDLCVRIRRLGYQILYVPDASIDHVAVRLKSGAKKRLSFQYSVARNEAYFVSKHFPSVRAAVNSILVAPVRAVAHEMLRAGFGLALFPTRVAGGVAGYVRGIKVRRGD